MKQKNTEIKHFKIGQVWATDENDYFEILSITPTRPWDVYPVKARKIDQPKPDKPNFTRADLGEELITHTFTFAGRYQLDANGYGYDSDDLTKLVYDVLDEKPQAERGAISFYTR